jgi:alpha/beta hydrolase family protein DUF900
MRYVLSLRNDPAVGAGFLEIPSEDLEGEQAEDRLTRENSVVFLLHGFNVDKKSGTKGLGNLAAFVDNGGAAVVSVLWPGDHGIGFLSYPVEGKDADDTADAFCKYIERVLERKPDLSFVTHSLGARVAMGTIKRLAGRGFSIREVCLMAPAIDDFSLASPNEYREQVVNAGRVALLASKEDEVLKYAYPAGDLLQAFVFWDDLAGLALGYHGARAYDEDHGVPGEVLPVQIPEPRNSNHSDYIPDFKPKKKPKGCHQKNQRSAARFAAQVIRGDILPTYK